MTGYINEWLLTLISFCQIVHSDVYDDVVERILKFAANVKIGDPFQGIHVITIMRTRSD